jgi:hypothetical protein
MQLRMKAFPVRLLQESYCILGDNYVKDFSRTTDPNGQFVYHWIIGENGDAGELTIEAQIVASGYESLQARSAFQITGR